MKKLIIYKDEINEWRWRITSKGRIVAEGGEGYKRKAGVLKTLKSLFPNYENEVKVIYL